MTFATLLSSIAMALLFAPAAESVRKYDSLDFIDPRPIRSPNIEQCLMGSIRTFIERLRHGLPELGFSEVEPLIIPHLKVSIKDRFYVDARLTNVSAWGVSKLIVTDIKASAEPLKTQLLMTFSIPTINVTARIDANFTVMFVSSNIIGDYKATLRGVSAVIFIGAQSVMRNGIKYMKPETVGLTFSVADASQVKIENSGSFVESFANRKLENEGMTLLDAMRPELIEQFVPLIKAFATKIFDQTPYDAWIRDDDGAKP